MLLSLNGVSLALMVLFLLVTAVFSFGFVIVTGSVTVFDGLLIVFPTLSTLCLFL